MPILTLSINLGGGNSILHEMSISFRFKITKKPTRKHVAPGGTIFEGILFSTWLTRLQIPQQEEMQKISRTVSKIQQEAEILQSEIASLSVQKTKLEDRVRKG
jgi:hypothetical protein